jgi:hypothetical protein
VRHTDDAQRRHRRAYRFPAWELDRRASAASRKAVPTEEKLACGEAGYETHLAVIHWTLGNSSGWRQWLTENPPPRGHPQHIWAVDLNRHIGTKTKPREPAERIYP